MDTELQYASERAERRGLKREALAEQICLHLLFAALGALLGSAELLFSVRPFGVALAAAAYKLTPAIALGAAVFGMFTRDYLSVAAIGITALCRLACSLFPLREDKRKPPLFGERAGFRVLAATVAIFITSLVRLVQGDFRYYHLFALLLGTLAAALAALLLTGLFLPRDRLFPYSREAGLAALVLLSVFALREVSLIGIYPAAVAAALAAFWLAAHYGIVLGAAGGALAGLCFDPLCAPAFLLCGLGLALLEKSSRGAGILGGCGAATAYLFAVLGSEGVLRVLPALLVAGALFLAGDGAGVIEGSPARRAGVLRRRHASQAARVLQMECEEKRLAQLSDALGDISGILYELGGSQRRPGLLDLRHLCDREFDKVCPQCTYREICWGSEYAQTAESVSAMSARLHATGRVDKAKLPPALAARCRSLQGILEGINNSAQHLFEEALRGDKTSVVAMDYAALSRMIADALQKIGEEHVLDSAASDRVAACLIRMGYTLESVSVCGKTHRLVWIRGIRLPGRRIKLRELRQAVEQNCRFALGEAHVSEQEGASDILFPERVRLSSVTVKQTRAKAKGEGQYCGDSVMSFSTTDGRDYAYLCDGMGSGNAAALTSALSATVLSRLLRAGNSPETSLRILNGLLAARGRRESESSTTVDLLQLDCVSGEAALYKCGAAPTYLLRRGGCTRFFSRTAPVGILETLDAEKIRFEVETGDVLVQVSDGVTKGEEECPWLSEMLTNRYDGDAEKFARLVLARASEEGADDLSILITEICAVPAQGTA